MNATIVIIAFQIYLIYTCYCYFGMLPFPTITVIYLSMSQLIYGLVHDGFANDEMLAVYEIGGLRHNFAFTQLFYLAVSAYITFTCVMFRTRSATRSLTISVTQLQKVISRGVSAVLFIALTAQLWVLAVYVNWDIVRRNDEYLLMTNPVTVVGNSSFLQGLFSSVTFVGPLAATMSAFNYSIRRRIYFAAFGAISLCYFLFLLSAHSRSAALIPIAFAAVLWMIGADRRLKAILAATVLAALSILSGLAGRGSELHGLASLPETFTNIWKGDNGKTPLDIFANICQGIFVTGEGFRVTEIHSTSYKLLSLSPFPSFIDGFADINDAQQIRLHDYVPMSGFTEFYLFGAPFNMMCLNIITLSIYICMKLRNLNAIVFMICNILQFLSFYLLNAYPIRNGFKPVWLIYFLASIVVPVVFRRRRSARRRRVANGFGAEETAFPDGNV